MKLLPFGMIVTVRPTIHSSHRTRLLTTDPEPRDFTLPPISSVAFSPAHTVLYTEPESQESTEDVSPREGIASLDTNHPTEHNTSKVNKTDKPPDSDKGTRTATYDDSTPLNVDADNPVG